MSEERPAYYRESLSSKYEPGRFYDIILTKKWFRFAVAAYPVNVKRKYGEPFDYTKLYHHINLRNVSNLNVQLSDKERQFHFEGKTYDDKYKEIVISFRTPDNFKANYRNPYDGYDNDKHISYHIAYDNYTCIITISCFREQIAESVEKELRNFIYYY